MVSPAAALSAAAGERLNQGPYDRAPAIAGTSSGRPSDVSAATAARRRPMATAAADPASDSTADTTSAGRYPATTPAEEASEPCAVNTAVTIAIPNAPPNRPKVLFTPEAVPTSAGGTEPSAA